MKEESLGDRLSIRASIRRNIKTRKSVQEGKPDRLSDLLDEAAARINKKLCCSECFQEMAFTEYDNAVYVNQCLCNIDDDGFIT
jgi:hypothetical protein